MKKTIKLFICFMSLMILWQSVSIEANADSFEYPEGVTVYRHEGFLYRKVRKGENKGCIRIIYYRGRKKDITVPKKIKGQKVISISGYGRIRNLHVPNGIEIRNIGDADCIQKVTVNRSNKRYCVRNGMLFNKEKTVLYWCPRDVVNPQIPKSVKLIKKQAFWQAKLERIVITENVRYIGEDAFAFCNNLEEVEFNNGLRKIYSGAFRGCISLESIDIPDSVRTIGGGAFSECNKLEKVKLSNRLKVLYSMFGSSLIKEIEIPKSVEMIWEGAFRYCELLERVYIYNENCEFKYDKKVLEYSIPIPKNVAIYGYKDSTAEAYAKKFGNKFVELE